jgi:glycosyltransferase involved in cell wall biosynthesis
MKAMADHTGMMYSIIIPTADCPIIDQTLDALQNQGFDHSLFQVIVVGSDRLGIVQENELVHFDRTDAPLPPGVARNRGVKQASGEVIIFLDADCVPQKKWLAVMAEHFTNPATAVVGGGFGFSTENYWALCDNVSLLHDYLSLHPPGVRKQLPSGNLAIRRRCFEQVQGYSEDYPHQSGEDADLTRRLRLAGHSLYFEPRAIVLHNTPRATLAEIMRRSYRQGKYSIKMSAELSDGLPALFRSRIGVIAFAPLLAAAAAARTFANLRILRKFWITLPVIYLLKIVWCIGASQNKNMEPTYE